MAQECRKWSNMPAYLTHYFANIPDNLNENDEIDMYNNIMVSQYYNALNEIVEKYDINRVDWFSFMWLCPEFNTEFDNAMYLIADKLVNSLRANYSHNNYDFTEMFIVRYIVDYQLYDQLIERPQSINNNVPI